MTSRQKLLSWGSVGLLGMAVLLSPGAARIPACVLALAGLGVASLLISSRRRLATFPAVCWFLAAAAVATAIQLVPLPAAVVSLISPMTWTATTATHDVLGLAAPTWLPLSADPHSTWSELVKLIALLAMAAVFARTASDPKGRRRLLQAVTIIGAGTALVAIGHEALSATHVFGIYAPQTSAPQRFLSPLVNPNHLSSLMVITACLGVVFCAQASRNTERFAWLAVSSLALGLCLALRSRAGVLVMAIALALTTIGVIRRKLRTRRSREARQPIFAAAVVGASVVLVLVAFSWDSLSYEFSTKSVDDELSDPSGRVALWRASWQLVGEQPLVGVGRGAFESALPRIHGESHASAFAYAENEYLQPLVDWGLGMGGLILILFLWTLGRALRRSIRDTLSAGVGAALLAVALQAFVDFGLEIPGLAAVFVVLVLCLDTPTVRRGPRKTSRALLVGAGVLATCAVAVAVTSLREDRRSLRDVAEEDVVTAAKRAMLRHPADHMAPAWVASALFAQRHHRAAMFANRALFAQPRSPSMHLLVARLLFSSGRHRQACNEYRLTGLVTRRLEPLVAEIATRYSTPQEIAACVPTRSTSPPSPVLILKKLEQWEAALALARRAAQAPQVEVAAWIELASLELTHGSPAAAAAAADRAIAMGLDNHHAIALAPIVERTDSAEAASALLERALRTAPLSRRAALWIALAQAALRQDQLPTASEYLDMALRHAGGAKVRAQVHRVRSALERRRGNLHRARWEQQRAEELSP